MKNGVGGLTILSCDNLQHNGTTAEKAFRSFFKLQDKELSRWAEKNVSFPNSMVDRITPSVSQEDIARLNKENGLEDLAPVYCEDFTQWVVEDDFVAGRPSWERVGVKLTKDVAPYENMKLSLLNASHTMLSYPAFPDISFLKACKTNVGWRIVFEVTWLKLV
jgi:mannitol 2-dehydrogenase